MSLVDPKHAPPTPAPPADSAHPARPSAAQILASVLTAVTTTFGLSYLGVAGTIIGAALASTFTVLANYWYTRSILHTQARVTALAPKTARARTAVPNDAQTAVVPRVHAPEAGAGASATPETSDVFTAPLTSEPTPGRDLMAPARGGHTRIRWRFIATIAAVFVGLLGLVTVADLMLGKPLADALRGNEGSGTTVFQSRVPKPDVENGPQVPGGPVSDEPGATPTDTPDPEGDESTAPPEDPSVEVPGAPEPTPPPAPDANPAPDAVPPGTPPTAPANPTPSPPTILGRLGYNERPRCGPASA